MTVVAHKIAQKSSPSTKDGLLFYCLDSSAFIYFSQTIKQQVYPLRREPRERN